MPEVDDKQVPVPQRPKPRKLDEHKQYGTDPNAHDRSHKPQPRRKRNNADDDADVIDDRRKCRHEKRPIGLQDPGEKVTHQKGSHLKNEDDSGEPGHFRHLFGRKSWSKQPRCRRSPHKQRHGDTSKDEDGGVDDDGGHPPRLFLFFLHEIARKHRDKRRGERPNNQKLKEKIRETKCRKVDPQRIGAKPCGQ